MSNTTEKKNKPKEELASSQKGTGGNLQKTVQDYYNEQYLPGKASLDQQHKTWQETDANTLQQINESIDRAAKTATGQYQQRIDAAPLESRAQYDQNAVADAVAKKQVQARLASMGVTDSGLNSSMQTAMAIQKQKADAGVRATEAAKIQEAQNQIDKILSDAAISKSEQKTQMERATADRYANALMDLEASSRANAASYYATDQQIGLQRDQMAMSDKLARDQMANADYWNGKNLEHSRYTFDQNLGLQRDQMDMNATLTREQIAQQKYDTDAEIGFKQQQLDKNDKLARDQMDQENYWNGMQLEYNGEQYRQQWEDSIAKVQNSIMDKATFDNDKGAEVGGRYYSDYDAYVNAVVDDAYTKGNLSPSAWNEILKRLEDNGVIKQ